MSDPRESVRDVVTKLTQKQLNLGDRELGPGDDLWNLGMTSLSCMGLMLEVENTFDIELPVDQLNHETFTSVNGIVAAVESAQQSAQQDAGADGAPART
ncbi:phosphopantetheine-binding protein [Actinokineospora inagensis]|uniref:phosphopantetheine-binding protein n=1 Tax=Actinokineospora inagensis TaxID=103730 RepID=UPI000421091F|nr:phosphopantetheine-binding protein [Actinokineospora inagensis]